MLKRHLNSYRYALNGIVDLFRSEVNARIHIAATLVVVAAGFYFQVSDLEWVALTLCIVSVIALEAVNTAIEYLTNLVSPDYHPLAGKTKDMAAGAVLIAAIGSIVIALIVFLPKMNIL